MAHELPRKLVAELRALGVTDARIVPGGKHPRIVGTVAGKSRFLVIPSSSGDWRAEANARACMKRVFGVRPANVRPTRERREKTKRKPSSSLHKRVSLLELATLASPREDRFRKPLEQLLERMRGPASHAEATPNRKTGIVRLRTPFLGRAVRFQEDC